MVTMDGVNNLFVSGVKSPPEALLAKMGDFDLHTLEAYDPRLLAKYPAGLYAIDFDKASLEARGMAASLMRARHHNFNSGAGYDISVWSNVVDMQFQLILAPVWIATLLEADGDVRTAVVNGQTGRTALGKARKPE